MQTDWQVCAASRGLGDPSSELLRTALQGSMRFSLIAHPFDIASMTEPAVLSEQLGYDALYVGDHLFYYAEPVRPWLDGWPVLASWIHLTTRIRLGMLTTNLSWRSPVTVARATIALDVLSGGRIDLGVGVGRTADQAMAGMLDMPDAERVVRLDEGLTVLDRLLRGDHTPFAGRFTEYQHAQTEPGCVQTPRPPLIFAAHGPRNIDVAARHADVWSSFGGFGLSFDEMIAVTRQRSQTLTQRCETIGRDPASIGRSLLAIAIDPWRDHDALARLVDEMSQIKIDELVFIFPHPARRAEFERTSLARIPQFR